MTETTCDDIQHWERYSYDEVVYFGEKSEVVGTEFGRQLELMSAIDRYNFDQAKARFYYVTGPECRK